MCGLAGYINSDGAPASEALVQRMAAMIAHRGPDGDGSFVHRNLALGHRRLAIVDLSDAGHQPMQTPDKRFTLIYNGELFNHSELRLELQARGHRFVSHSDTEVVLHALAEWGPEVLRRFNGMFALALFDATANTLLLARDRYGIKPLYLARTRSAVLFGSEIKAFLPFPEMRAGVDLEGLIEYFTFQNFFTERTLFDGVQMVPAAHWIELDAANGQEKRRVRYWDYHFAADDPPRSDDDYLEELDFLFRQAVNRQMMGDRPISAYLSGGMDSGAISAVAAAQTPEMLTFTVGYDRFSASGLEMDFDERVKAEHMSYLFGTRHYEMVLKAGDMERALRPLVWHLEEPRVGQSYPNYYAAQLAGRFGRVVLSGCGGDEVFGGYPWRYYRTVEASGFEDYIDRYYRYWQRLLRNRDLWDAFAPIRDQVGQVWTRDIFRNVFNEHAETLTRPEDYVNHSLYLEARTFLHGLLTVEDKLSMAHSLETRVPFLDNDLVDMALRLPVHLKLGRLNEYIALNENDKIKRHEYLQKSRDGKILLRRMMGRHVPEYISEGVKQGFSAPDDAWFKGDSIDFVRERLLDRNARIYDWMDYGTITGLINQHLDGKANKRLLIWSLLYFDEWCNQFLRSRHPEPDQGREPAFAKLH